MKPEQKSNFVDFCLRFVFNQEYPRFKLALIAILTAIQEGTCPVSPERNLHHVPFVVTLQRASDRIDDRAAGAL